jgi:uncharacterized protein YndB with AHSA1/START domain
MSSMMHAATYELRGDRELVVTRTFRAPASLVWAAHTEPRHLVNWLTGPDGWSMPICEVDLRVGGAFKFGYHLDGRSDFFFSGQYLEVDAPRRIVSSEHFNGAEPGTRNTLEFTEAAGITTMVLTIEYVSAEMREMVLKTGMTGGMDTSYERLDALLASVAS